MPGEIEKQLARARRNRGKKKPGAEATPQYVYGAEAVELARSRGVAVEWRSPMWGWTRRPLDTLTPEADYDDDRRRGQYRLARGD